MLPKINRLNIRTEFHTLKSSGKKIADPLFLAYVAIVPGETIPSFNVSISKKIAKSAVTRNHLKRRINDALSKEIPKIKENTKGIIIVLKNFEHESEQTISMKIHEILRKAEAHNE